MARSGDRRPMLSDHAIAVLAGGGARALTHQAVDRAAGLAPGSTSYYFRTRDGLITATIEQIRRRSREAFEQAAVPEPVTVSNAALLMERQLVLLSTRRREDALAVFALLPEVERHPERRAELGECLFSQVLAADLFTALGSTDPEAHAVDLVDFLTGILFGLLFRQHRRAAGDGIAQALRSFLAGALPADRR